MTGEAPDLREQGDCMSGWDCAWSCDQHPDPPKTVVVWVSEWMSAEIPISLLPSSLFPTTPRNTQREEPIMGQVHVAPNKDGEGWSVTMETDPRIFPTQAEAEANGRELSKATLSELVIHGEDGEIREKDSHGNDPTEIPG